MNTLKYFALSLLICPAVFAMEKSSAPMQEPAIMNIGGGAGGAGGGSSAASCETSATLAKKCLCRSAYKWANENKAITVLGLIAGGYVAKKVYDKAHAYYVAHKPAVHCQVELDGKEVGKIDIKNK